MIIWYPVFELYRNIWHDVMLRKFHLIIHSISTLHQIRRHTVIKLVTSKKTFLRIVEHKKCLTENFVPFFLIFLFLANISVIIKDDPVTLDNQRTWSSSVITELSPFKYFSVWYCYTYLMYSVKMTLAFAYNLNADGQGQFSYFHTRIYLQKFVCL